MDACAYLSKLLDVPEDLLIKLDHTMASRLGTSHVLNRVAEENEAQITNSLSILNSGERNAPHVRDVLRKTVLLHENQLMTFVDMVEGESEFDKAAKLAKQIAKVGKGFFLKREYAEKILRTRNPQNLVQYLGYSTVDEVLAHHDVLEAFSALRFVECDAWMHDTFKEAYAAFTAEDFEERDIEIKVLGPEWHKIAEKFVAKKHHNVSHLKEFGVIFVNPLREDIPGKFLRDFALLLHYFHEIEFYSKLFRRYSRFPEFPAHLAALLRGDVKEAGDAKEGDWLIVQRYLFKENPQDPRLFLPRVNPESMHWLRGERDLALFSGAGAKLDMKLWHNLDWVGGIFEGDGGKVVSFDLEDNAMAAVAAAEGMPQYFSYHQREALWTKIFAEYVGGEHEMEKLLLGHFDRGVIKFFGGHQG